MTKALVELVGVDDATRRALKLVKDGVPAIHAADAAGADDAEDTVGDAPGGQFNILALAAFLGLAEVGSLAELEQGSVLVLAPDAEISLGIFGLMEAAPPAGGRPTVSMARL